MVKKMLKNPFAMFMVTFLVIAIPLFFFKITIFDGEILMKQRISPQPLPIKLSLSYFIGIGIDPKDLTDVKDFYLVGKGYFLAACLLIGFPSLMAYRSLLARKGY